MPRPALVLAAVAALMGAAGVALAAAATHARGGELGRTAAEFLILHAAALIAVCAHARGSGARAMIFTGALLALGTVLFSGDLAMRAFAETRLFPFAAPIGGTSMIIAWIGIALSFVWASIRERP
jgi:uncharacterized membrane protein YgdD (TMEM256/DUF423 family)